MGGIVMCSQPTYGGPCSHRIEPCFRAGVLGVCPRKKLSEFSWVRIWRIWEARALTLCSSSQSDTADYSSVDTPSVRCKPANI